MTSFSGEKLILKVRLVNGDYSYLTHGLLDTGSSVTIISKEIAKFLRLPDDPVRPRETLVTGSGVITVEQKSVEQFFVGHDRYPGVRVRVHDLPKNSKFPILIGMNVISRMRISINGPKKTFLARKA